MTVEEIRSYKQIRTPDYSLLANLVSKAKGPDRTMAQFAEVTGIGASTLSRLVNHNIKKPLALDVIIKIYECRADEEDTYLLDSLARANGFYPADYAQRVKDHESMAARRNAQLNREHQMKNALIAGVAAAGCGITVVDRPILRTKDLPAIYPSSLGDFILQLKENTTLGTTRNWSFITISRLVDEEECRYDAKFFARRFFQSCSDVLLLDAWKPEALKGYKISFAFVDKDILGEFWNEVRIAKVHTEMSLILIDPVSYRVLDEIWVPGDYNPMTNISVFRVPAPVEDDVYEETEDFYEEDPE